MKQLLHQLLSPLHRRRAIRALKKLEGRLPSKTMRLSVPFAYKARGLYRSIRPRQNPGEIERLYRRICELEPTNVLEIGTAKGGTLYLWAQAAAKDATLVSLDLPGGDFGGGYPEARVPLYQAFARERQTLHLLRADSHTDESLNKVRSLFNNNAIDFAFIDGDHTYEGAKQDFLAYGKLVRPGGLIGFHDILPQPNSPETQVHRLWDEIKGDHETWEFVDHAEEGYKLIGIGLLRVGEEGIVGGLP